MLDNLASLFMQPWIGARSDRLRSRLGRRLPIILIGMPFAALGFVLIPTAAQSLSGLAGFILVVMIMLLGMSAIRVPLFALMPDFTDSKHRSTANGIINLFGGLGTLIAALGLGVVYRINRAGPFWVAGGTLIVTVLILVVVIRKVAGDGLSNAGPDMRHRTISPRTRCACCATCWWRIGAGFPSCYSLSFSTRLALTL